MAVKIGHASIDENGKAQGGVAGDQTSKEVCTRLWYKTTWHTVLRCKDPKKAEAMAKACETACVKKVGYDQSQRNTLYQAAKEVGFNLEKIEKACECDCSSLMHVCAIAGGVKINYGSNGVTTRTMVKAFVATGEFEALTATQYLTSDKYLKRGDILVKSGHTVMVLEDGECTKEVIVTVEATLLKRGASGNRVKVLQILLNGLGYDCGEVDESFGPKVLAAVKKFQKEKGLTVDGSVGAKTWNALLKG